MLLDSKLEIFIPQMRSKLRSPFPFLRRAAGEWYRIFLERGVLKLFFGPERAVCYVNNVMPVMPAKVIGNYCLGLVLIGHKSEGLIWQTFPERAIITPETAHISKRLRGYMRRDEYEIRYNTNFEGVIRGCQRQEWTWINEPAINTYTELFGMGFVQTVEAYSDGEMVGGLWGLLVGNTFGIMSMFHRVDRAGAIALGTLVTQLSEGEYAMVDCGVLNSNFSRFGAQAVAREEFIRRVADGLHGTNSINAADSLSPIVR